MYFVLVHMTAWMNEWMNECMNGWMYECMNVWMYEPVIYTSIHGCVPSWTKTIGVFASRSDAKQLFSMVWPWQKIHTEGYTETPSGWYNCFRSLFHGCSMQMKYRLRGAPAYGFSVTFLYFPLAIASKSRCAYPNSWFAFFARASSPLGRRFRVMLMRLRQSCIRCT